MKILVVDDHALIREALRNVLRELDGNAVIYEAGSYAGAMRHLEGDADIDLVLLDLGLPDRDGFTVLPELRQSFPAVPVVVLSARNDHDNVAKALDLGALGFIPKSASREIMLVALRLVFAGGIYIPPDILKPSLPAAPLPPPAAPRAQPQSSPRDIGLTERQVEVLALMARGNSNKAICRKLDLAEPTVKNHVTAILKALKVTNRTEAVIAVGKMGWQLTLTGE
jgi:DNA-binding NarL/FixJ family response regulator